MTHDPGPDAGLGERAGWHAGPDTIDRYARLQSGTAEAASVEQHLLACAPCRAALGVAHARHAPEEVEALWLDVIDAVDRPRPAWPERVMVRLGVRDDLARMVAATPALGSSWIASVAVALAFAVGNAVRQDGSEALLLVLAPLIPLAGIALAHGPGVDPLEELARSAPVPMARVFLARALAVLVTAIGLTAGASLVLPIDRLAAMAWLLPSLGLVGATLALSTWMRPLVAAVVSGSAWLGLLGVAWFRTRTSAPIPVGQLFAFRPSGQVLFAAVAIAGMAVFRMRSEQLDGPASATRSAA